MATHSSVLAWRIPGTEEPDGLPSMGSHRVGHNWSNLAAAAAAKSPLKEKRPGRLTSVFTVRQSQDSKWKLKPRKFSLDLERHPWWFPQVNFKCPICLSFLDTSPTVQRRGVDWMDYLSTLDVWCFDVSCVVDGLPRATLKCVYMCVCSTLWPHGLWPTKLLYPWSFPGKNTGTGCHFLLQGIFPTQGSNTSLLCHLHWQVDYLPLHYLGSQQHSRSEFKADTESSLSSDTTPIHSFLQQRPHSMVGTEKFTTEEKAIGPLGLPCHPHSAGSLPTRTTLSWNKQKTNHVISMPSNHHLQHWGSQHNLPAT